MGSRTYREITVRVSLPALSEYYVEAYGRAFREAHRCTPEVAQVFRQVPPGGDAPVVPMQHTGWRAFVGGIVLAIKPYFPLNKYLVVPQAPGGAFRAIAVIEDAVLARQVLDLDQTHVRKFAWLVRAEDGTWAAILRWSPTTKEERKKRMKPRVKRWFKAPSEWPRKSDGKTLVPTSVAIRMLGEAKVKELLKLG